MQEERIDLIAAGPGQRAQLRVLRFGRAGNSPKAYIQAALHADEVPGMAVAQRLRHHLLTLETQGRLTGEVVLVPYANPLGLGQQVLGHAIGRFDLRDGNNFNRHYPDLAAAALPALQGRLGDDAAHNRSVVRAALCAAAAALSSLHPAADLKNRLLALAIDADTVLDLHCDAEAVMHLYTLTPHADVGLQLGALLGAEALLLADDSGDAPFDEACSRPWVTLGATAAPLPLACFSATVELRGEADTSHALAEQDALALIAFLHLRGVIDGDPPPVPPSRCAPTPLAASEPITADRAGIVIFHRAPGERLAAGDVVADIVDVDSGEIHPLRAISAGLLYARAATRWAVPGKRLAKIAGTTLARSGKLLSP